MEDEKNTRINLQAQATVLKLLQKGHDVIMSGRRGGEGKSYVLQQALNQDIIQKPLYFNDMITPWQEQIRKHNLPLRIPLQTLIFKDPQSLSYIFNKDNIDKIDLQCIQFCVLLNNGKLLQSWLQEQHMARKYITILNSQNRYQSSYMTSFCIVEF